MTAAWTRLVGVDGRPFGATEEDYGFSLCTRGLHPWLLTVAPPGLLGTEPRFPRNRLSNHFPVFLRWVARGRGAPMPRRRRRPLGRITNREVIDGLIPRRGPRSSPDARRRVVRRIRRPSRGYGPAMRTIRIRPRGLPRASRARGGGRDRTRAFSGTGRPRSGSRVSRTPRDRRRSRDGS